MTKAEIDFGSFITRQLIGPVKTLKQRRRLVSKVTSRDFCSSPLFSGKNNEMIHIAAVESLSHLSGLIRLESFKFCTATKSPSRHFFPIRDVQMSPSRSLFCTPCKLLFWSLKVTLFDIGLEEIQSKS